MRRASAAAGTVALVAGIAGFPIPLGAVGALALALGVAYLALRALRRGSSRAPGDRPIEGEPTLPSSPPMRPRRGFAVVLFAAFIAAVAPLLWFHVEVLRAWGHLVYLVGHLLFWPRPWPGFTPKATADGFLTDLIFLMYLAFLLAYVVASGLLTDPKYTAAARGRAGLLILAYVAVELLLDAVFFTVPGRFVASSFLLVRAVTGGAFFALLVLSTAFAPPPVRIDPVRPPDRRALPALLLTGLISLGLSTVLLYLLFRYVGLGREGLPLAVLLLLPLSALTIWGALGRIVYDLNLITRPRPAVSEFHPPVSVLVPAFNEERDLAECVASVDAAAARYPGTTEVVVANDGSSDATSAVARTAIAGLAHARGRCLELAHGGKAHALNAALAVATGEVIVRLDADARIAPGSGFGEMVPHFADPDVGGVQGEILPREDHGWTRSLRLLEVSWSHLYLRRAMMAVRSAEVVDGVFSAFRRADLVRGGGWVAWNGEDTEVTLRLQRQGYRMRLETGAVALEDVPTDLASLRRQRLRWNRGSLFAHRRHAGAVTGPALAYGGLAILFWFLLFARGGLRTFVWAYAVASTVLLGLPTLLHVGAIAVLLLVPRGIAVGYYLGRVGRTRALPWLLAWPVLAALKQFFQLEAFGTMRPGGPPEIFV